MENGHFFVSDLCIIRCIKWTSQGQQVEELLFVKNLLEYPLLLVYIHLIHFWKAQIVKIEVPIWGTFITLFVYGHALPITASCFGSRFKVIVLKRSVLGQPNCQKLDDTSASEQILLKLICICEIFPWFEFRLNFTKLLLTGHS